MTDATKKTSDSIRCLDSASADFESQFQVLLQRDASSVNDVAKTVTEIIQTVRQNGDASLVEYTRQFDRLSATTIADLELEPARLQQARERLEPTLWQALVDAEARIRQFHERQLHPSWDYEEADGTRLGQKVSPIARAGIYVPGGLASYPSSVLMSAVAASVAGVKEIIMAVPTPDGEVNEAVLAAALLAGVSRVFCIGGAQAVAALAYGTETVPAVDKIVGPGNVYVAEAKRQVFGKVGIDMIAGPSEVLIIADQNADPEWIAMDLFAQAEHDELAQSILISDSAELISEVHKSIDKMLPEMTRRDIIGTSLRNQGALIKVNDLYEAVELSNQVAPEHLEIFIDEADALVDRVVNAGAIFVGRHSAESLGDYCAGPNHVLPTAGTARFSSPLGVYDFQKRTSLIRVSAGGAKNMARTAAVLARAEGLEAHARSAELRLNETDSA